MFICDEGFSYTTPGGFAFVESVGDCRINCIIGSAHLAKYFGARYDVNFVIRFFKIIDDVLYFVFVFGGKYVNLRPLDFRGYIFVCLSYNLSLVGISLMLLKLMLVSSA